MRVLTVLSLFLVATGCQRQANLAQRLRSPDPQVRREAIYTIGEMGNAGADLVPALVEAMQDPDKYVRHAAINALMKIGSAGVPSPLAFSALKEAVRDPSPSMRASALSGLRVFGRAEDILPIVRETLEDPDAKVRRETLFVLSDLLAETGGETLPLLTRALRDSDAEVRGSAALWLSELARLQRVEGIEFEANAEAAAISALIEALNDEDIHVRSTAEGALSSMELRAVPALCSALGEERVLVRRYAAKALSSICSEAFLDRGFAKRIIPLVLEALLQGAVDDEPIVREACAEALAYLSPDDARAEKATEALLRDRDRGVRNVTRRVLQEMGKLPASAKPSAEDGQVDSEQ